MAKIPSDIRDRLDRQALLIDTSVIIKSLTYDEFKKSVFPVIDDLSLTPTILPEIKFEFLRSAYINDLVQAREKFIGDWVTIPVNEKMRETAIKIGRIYQTFGLNPSLTDCIMAAVLKYFAGRLFLITLNHKDFPPILFERVFFDVVDAASKKGNWEMLHWGVYGFDEKKYSSQQKRLRKIATRS